MRNLLKILLLGFGLGFVTGLWFDAGVQEYILPYQTAREQVMALQGRAGCSKIDGVIGPETTRLVNQAVKDEEPNLFNSFAEPYFTESGGLE